MKMDDLGEPSFSGNFRIAGEETSMKTHGCNILRRSIAKTPVQPLFPIARQAPRTAIQPKVLRPSGFDLHNQELERQ